MKQAVALVLALALLAALIALMIWAWRKPNRIRFLVGLGGVLWIVRLVTSDTPVDSLSIVTGVSALLLLIMVFAKHLRDGEIEKWCWGALFGGNLAGSLLHDSNLWIQGGAAILFAVVLYAFQNAMGKPLSYFSANRSTGVQGSFRAAAWLMGMKRNPDGTYQNPEVQQIMEDLERNTEEQKPDDKAE